VHIAERTDREKYVDELRSLGAPIEYYYATRQKDGRRGCYESHQAIMKESLSFDNALIFEDDAVAVNLFGMFEVQAFMAKNTDWDIIYLGCFPDVFRTQTHVTGNMYLVKASMTHAYVVSQKYMKTFVKRPYDGIPIDNVFRNEAKTYALSPVHV
jgi:GR25 family glycosyltransferase involved in LPS biosynthesis